MSEAGATLDLRVSPITVDVGEDVVALELSAGCDGVGVVAHGYGETEGAVDRGRLIGQFDGSPVGGLEGEIHGTGGVVLSSIAVVTNCRKIRRKIDVNVISPPATIAEPS